MWERTIHSFLLTLVPQANRKAVISCSPRLNKDTLRCSFSKSPGKNWTNLKELCNKGINVRITIKDITNKGRLCMNSPTPEA